MTNSLLSVLWTVHLVLEAIWIKVSLSIEEIEFKRNHCLSRKEWIAHSKLFIRLRSDFFFSRITYNKFVYRTIRAIRGSKVLINNSSSSFLYRHLQLPTKFSLLPELKKNNGQSVNAEIFFNNLKKRDCDERTSCSIVQCDISSSAIETIENLIKLYLIPKIVSLCKFPNSSCPSQIKIGKTFKNCNLREVF